MPIYLRNGGERRQTAGGRRKRLGSLGRARWCWKLPAGAERARTGGERFQGCLMIAPLTLQHFLRLGGAWRDCAITAYICTCLSELRCLGTVSWVCTLYSTLIIDRVRRVLYNTKAIIYIPNSTPLRPTPTNMYVVTAVAKAPPSSPSRKASG